MEKVPTCPTRIPPAHTRRIPGGLETQVYLDPREKGILISFILSGAIYIGHEIKIKEKATSKPTLAPKLVYDLHASEPT